MLIIETDKDLAAFARSLALEEAALIAEKMARENRKKAVELHLRSNRQAAAFMGAERAEQTKISAQVLDACADECEAVAAAVRKVIQKAAGGCDHG